MDITEPDDQVLELVLSVGLTKYADQHGSVRKILILDGR